MSINLYAIPFLLSATIVLIAGIFILFQNLKNHLNIIFFFVCLSTSVWQGFLAINFLYESNNAAFRELLLRIDYCGVTFLGVTIFHFIITFLNFKSKKINLLVILHYLYGIISSTLILTTNYIISGSYHYFYGYYPQAGAYHPIFLAYYWILCPSALIPLIIELKRINTTSQKAQQIKYLIIAFGILLLANWDFIPNYGVELYPFGSVPILIFILIVGYSVIRHNFLDIAIILNKGIVYSILITFITTLYLLLVLTFEKLSQDLFKYNSFVVSILSAFLISILFIPLKNWIQNIIDHIVFKSTPQQLAIENQALRITATESERNKIIATLASGVAHEIRNPLTALKTFIEYFPSKKNDPQFLAKFESIASNEITRIEQIVNELLQFAKPSPLALKDINIQQILEHALSLTSNQLQKNNITVKTNYAPNLPLIKADSNKLLQVFINLILNAIDAMSGGGTLTVIASEAKQSHSTEIATSQNTAPRNDTRKKYLTISITDTGSGISKEHLKQIFEPFFSTKEKGTGLGLAIVKGIIEDHGGQIGAVSEVNQGTTFIINLPPISYTKPKGVSS